MLLLLDKIKHAYFRMVPMANEKETNFGTMANANAVRNAFNLESH